MIRLNDINNFIEISEFPSFNLASKKLGVTQPALSESIKRLEKDLENKLFYRTKSGVSLTPEGKMALEKCKNIKNILNELEHNNSGDKLPLLTLGCHPAIGSYFLPRFIKLTDSLFKEGRFNIQHDLSRNIQLLIQSGEVDFGVVVNPLPNPDLILKPIAIDKIRVWKSSKKVIKPRVIADSNLFQTQSILREWKGHPEEMMFSSSLETIARLTNEGCGYGIIPERLVKLLNLELTVVKESPSFSDKFYLIYRPEFGKTKYEKKIIELIVKSFS